MKNQIIPIFIPHLGCPFDCVFCNQRRIASPDVPSGDDISAIIENALKYTKNPQISFYGGSFTAIGQPMMVEYLSAAYPFIKDGRCDSIRLSTRPDAINESILNTLSEYGVRTIELGAQSMSDKVLIASGRGHTAQDTVTSSRLIKEHGFELILQMMVGLPESRRIDETETAQAIAALNPDGVRIYPTCVIEDTPLCDMYRAGEYGALSVEAAVDISADLIDIFETHNIPVVRLGLNPTDELSNGGVVAGAYHPALGELVYSEIFRRKVMASAPKEGEYSLVVPCKKLSVAIGQRRTNLMYFKANTGIKEIIGDANLTNDFEIKAK